MRLIYKYILSIDLSIYLLTSQNDGKCRLYFMRNNAITNTEEGLGIMILNDEGRSLMVLVIGKILKDRLCLP